MKATMHNCGPLFFGLRKLKNFFVDLNRWFADDSCHAKELLPGKILFFFNFSM
jgi:hypothetical protein